MAHASVEAYLNDVLKPQLAAFGAPDDIADTIIGTVRMQMSSCIRHWKDVPFREALLLTGEEEGTYYFPKAGREIRAFVVVTLRNSPLESIHADSYRGRRLLPEDIQAITSAAIKHFKDADFMALSEQENSDENDCYGLLAKKHPMAWAAFLQLSNMGKQTAKYKPLPVLVKPSLHDLQTPGQPRSIEARSGVTHVMVDGYAPDIDPGILQSLQTAVTYHTPFISDSLKGVSRNLEKLLTIIEFVLGNDLAFVTSNYYIENGYVARRPKPVKPGHDLPEMKRNWLNGAGLTEKHKYWLQAAARA